MPPPSSGSNNKPKKINERWSSCQAEQSACRNFRLSCSFLLLVPLVVYWPIGTGGSFYFTHQPTGTEFLSYISFLFPINSKIRKADCSACHLVSSSFLAWLILRSCRWRQYRPPKNSVEFQRITWRYIVKDKTIHNHLCENLKSYSCILMSCTEATLQCGQL
jgi:hypothetical protein